MTKRYIVSLTDKTLEDVFLILKIDNKIFKDNIPHIFISNNNLADKIYNLEKEFDYDYNKILLYILDNKLLDDLDTIYDNTVILELPDEYNILHLYNYDGCIYKQTGFILGPSINTINTYYHDKESCIGDPSYKLIEKYIIPFNKEDGQYAK